MIRIDSPRLVAGGRGAETYTYSTLTAALGELNEIAHGRDGSPYIWRAAADSHEPRELPAGLPADQPALWEKDGQLVTTDPLRALLALANAELDDPNITITIDHTRRYTRVPGDRWQYGDDTERRWSIHDPVPIFARV